jgi:KDO2-lipid IV(A) lauroyltransferase
VLSRLLVALLWLLHFLPLSILAACGSALGSAFFVLARRRRHIVLVNLGLCFPDLDDEQRRLLAKAHFRVLGRSVLERSLLLWASQERLSRLIRVEGEERMRTLLAAGRPVLMLTPHFVGLDAGGAGLPCASTARASTLNSRTQSLTVCCYAAVAVLAISYCFSRDESVRAQYTGR